MSGRAANIRRGLGLGLGWRVAALKNGFRDATVYRIEFISEIFGAAFVPAAIQAVLWYAIFKVGGATEIAGMNYSELVRYTLATILFTQIRGGDHDFELMEMIRTGQLSNYLLRPVGVIEFVYIRGVASRLLIAGICLLLGMGVGIWFGLSPGRMLGAMFLAVLGNVIHYQIGSVLATIAFLWEDAYSLLMVKNMAVSILSGELLPLNLFPEATQWVWKSLPFYLYVFGPAQYALGHWSHVEFARNLAIAFLWILFFWGAIRMSWKWGMKTYVSVGG